MDFDYVLNKFCQSKCKLFSECILLDKDDEFSVYCPLYDFLEVLDKKLETF